MTWEEIMRRVLLPVGGVSPRITDPGSYGAGVEQGRSPPSSIPHRGVDFNYPVGQTGINLTNPVLHSPVAGVVTNAGEGSTGRIAIKDANGFSHEILHTHTHSVRVGDLVGVGQPIGTMGNTGVKTANIEKGDHHVHYQLRDRAGNAINPTEFWNRLDPARPILASQLTSKKIDDICTRSVSIPSGELGQKRQRLRILSDKKYRLFQGRSVHSPLTMAGIPSIPHPWTPKT